MANGSGTPPLPAGFENYTPVQAQTPPLPSGYEGYQPVSAAPTSPSDAGLPADVAARHARSREGVNYAPTGQTGLTGVLEGGGKEVANTVAGGASLVNKVLPDSMQLPKPDVQTLHGTAETIGGGIEQLAEFAGGDELLKAVGAMAHIGAHAPQVLKLMEDYPKATKVITSMLKGAAVGGAQGGIKGAATGEGTEGAIGGAEGGAVGAGVGEVAGAALGPLAKSVGLGTTSEEDIVRAAQPGKRNYQFLPDWALAAPKIRESLGPDVKFKDFNEASTALRQVKQGVWRGEVVPTIERHASEIVDPKPIIKAVRDKVTTTSTKFYPEEAKTIEEFANQFINNKMTVEDAENLLEKYNADLESAYYDKSPDARAAIEKSDPEILAKRTAADAIREQLYHHLETNPLPGDGDIATTKKVYGAIGNIEREIHGQAQVAGRQRPLSLKQVLALTHAGPLGIGAVWADKLYNAPPALLNRALAKTAPPSTTGKVVSELGRRAVGVAKTGAAVAGENVGAEQEKSKGAPISENQDTSGWVRFTASNGKNYEIHPEDLAAAKKADPGLKVLGTKPTEQPQEQAS